MAIARVGASGQPIPMGGIGDILEGTGRYMGPGRLIPPAIGGGSAWGLQALWNKITGGEDDIELTDEEKKAVEDAREKHGDAAADATEKQLKQIKKVFQPQIDEQEKELEKTIAEEKKMRIKIKNKIKSELIFTGVEEELAESLADSATERAFEKMYEGISGPQAMDEALQELDVLSRPEGTKHAYGGLVGINHLTRGL